MAPERRPVSFEQLLGLVLLVTTAGIVLYEIVTRVLIPAAPDVGQAAASSGLPSDLLFYGIAGVITASCAGVAFSKNIVYSSFSLLGALLGTGAIYIYLSADFLAVTQLLVYVGGVLVLILFAVMLTHHIRDVEVSNISVQLAPGLAGLAALLALLGYLSGHSPWKTGPVEDYHSTAEALGNAFLGTYLLPFEIASVILLAALIGAVVIARKEIKPD